MSLEDAIIRLAIAIENAAAAKPQGQITPAANAAPTPTPKKGRPAAKQAQPAQPQEVDETAEYPEDVEQDEVAPSVNEGVTLEQLRDVMIELQKVDLPAFKSICADFKITKLPDLKPAMYDRVHQATVAALAAANEDTISLD